RRRREEDQHFRCLAVAQNLNDVARHVAEAALPALVVESFIEDLAADLEVVAAEPAVLEVAERAEDLIACGDVEPTITVAAADHVGAQVRIGWRIRVPRVRPEVMELAASNLEERLVADDAVVLALIRVRPVRLVPRRVGALVNGGGRTDEKRIEAIRLLFLR